MSEMVERVAKALLDEMATQTGYEPWVWRELSEPQREYYRRCARAAIAAMRVPTKAMIDAAYDPCEFGSDYHAEGIYTAMIDAAQDKPA